MDDEAYSVSYWQFCLRSTLGLMKPNGQTKLYPKTKLKSDINFLFAFFAFAFALLNWFPRSTTIQAVQPRPQKMDEKYEKFKLK